MIQVNAHLSIPQSELKFTASRSGGPGGQNVNKVSTRVMLRFDVAGSPSVTDEQRRRIFQHLRNRVTRDGVLVVVSQEFRTQSANRAAVLERFVELVRAALKPRPVRRRTKTPASAKRRRVEGKIRRSRVKRLRSKGIALQ